VSQRFRA